MVDSDTHPGGEEGGNQYLYIRLLTHQLLDMRDNIFYFKTVYTGKEKCKNQSQQVFTCICASDVVLTPFPRRLSYILFADCKKRR